MPDIVLTTLNARYAHASFGLRYLLANLGELRDRARLLEFDIAARSTDVVEAILAEGLRIVGIGVYIWNAEQSLRVVAEIKRVRPDVIVVLGGPEVSYETEEQEICRLADYVITGEGDLAFAELCGKLLSGTRPLNRVIAADLPAFAGEPASAGGSREGSRFGVQGSVMKARPLKRARLPYDLYTSEDIARRVIYVEASRGCPFKCEFCLSSLDVPVRNVPLDEFLAAMQSLLDRGARRLKFVDRTFNLNLTIGRAILAFFLERYEPGMFLHFEMIPDRLPEALRQPIAAFPPGALQFEVGIQSFDEEVCKRISRRQNVAKIEENLRFLRDHTGVHVHADLIVGLPGEDLETFGRGFDRLVALRPQEIQVGKLKRLRGAPIARHDVEWGMVYSPHPPYEVLRTGAMDFATLQRMRRFARYWDVIANSGNFVETTPVIWQDGGSPFESFMRLTEWLYEQTGRTHAIALQGMVELLFRFLATEGARDVNRVAESLWRDYQRGGRSDCPPCLRAHVAPADTRVVRASRGPAAPARQARHAS